MSGATVISHGYEAASELSLRFGRALCDVKAASLGVSTMQPDEAVALMHSVADLTEILDALGEAMLPHDDLRHEPLSVEVPDGLATWLRATGRGNAVGVASLTLLSTAIRADAAALSDPDLHLLEHINRVIGAHAHHLFTQLGRAHAGAA